MEKINIVELLKDCPKGMELDCTMFEGIEFDSIVDNDYFPIRCRIKNSNDEYNFYNLTKYGYWNNDYKAKCVIFPKGKTTWEGFQRPFKDGDIIFTHANCLKVGVGNTWISIFQENRNGGVATYVDYTEDGGDYYDNIDGSKGLLCMEEDILRQRLATKEEKQKLFDAIKANGYEWNAKTKALVELIEPKFKIGDKIKHIKTGNIYEIIKILLNCYIADYFGSDITILFNKQDEYELVPDKFDITTLKPFDRVLVRTDNKHVWTIQFFEKLNNILKDPFVCMRGERYHQCIPYEGNEHLLNTANDCDEYYKTWK